MSEIYICKHCGVQKTTTGLLCQYCNTKEKRDAMHEENKKIYAERGMVYRCPICDRTAIAEDKKITPEMFVAQVVGGSPKDYEVEKE